MVGILEILWRVSMLACFVVFIAVIVTIIDVRKRPEPVLMPSVWLWVLGSIFGGILWVAGSGALFGFGIIGMALLQVGPLLYIWTGYLIVSGSRKPDQVP